MMICQKQDVIIFISLRHANGRQSRFDFVQLWFGSYSAIMIKYVAIEVEMYAAGMDVVADMGMHQRRDALQHRQ